MIPTSCVCSAALLVALGPPAGVGGSVRGGRGAELLPDRLHPPGQRELRAAADLSREDRQGHLQVHGHLPLGLSGVHDRHVQPVLVLPGREGERRLHDVRHLLLFPHAFLNGLQV